MKNKDNIPNLKVTVRDRRKILFEGEVKSLSSVNQVGDFDVLPMHANFVSLIKKEVVLDKGTSYEEVFEIDSGLLSVDEDGVDVYVGIGKVDKKDESKDEKKEDSKKKKGEKETKKSSKKRSEKSKSDDKKKDLDEDEKEKARKAEILARVQQAREGTKEDSNSETPTEAENSTSDQ